MSGIKWLDAILAAFAIIAFAWSCVTEHPYMAAFWGVWVVCDAIKERDR